MAWTEIIFLHVNTRVRLSTVYSEQKVNYQIWVTSENTQPPLGIGLGSTYLVV